VQFIVADLEQHYLDLTRYCCFMRLKAFEHPMICHLLKGIFNNKKRSFID